MPTKNEFTELYDNCTREWTSINSVAGLLLTSNINGKSVFFPASGFYHGTILNSRGEDGLYWSSSYYSATHANNFFFSSSVVYSQNTSSRRSGFTVRPVREP